MDSPIQSRPPRPQSQPQSHPQDGQSNQRAADRYETNPLARSPPGPRVSDLTIDRYESNPEPVTSNSRRPLYNDRSDPPPRSSTLPYRPRPDAPETTSAPARTHRASEPPPASYSHPPPPAAPTQGPHYTTTSPTLYHNPFQTDLSRVSPRPMSGPDPKFESIGPTQPIYPAPTTNYLPPTTNHLPTHNSYSGHAPTTATAPPPPPAGPPLANATTNALQNPQASSNPPTLRSTLDTAETALRELLAVRRQQAMLATVGGGGGGGTGLGINGVGGSTGGGVNGAGVGVMGVNGVGMMGVNGYGKVDQAAEVEGRRRMQTGLVLMGLRGLQARVEAVVGKAEGERWRRFAVGGVVASFLPLVKRLFRRRRGNEDADESSNRTEYAFKKSKSLVSRILAATHRPGLGTIAFFVFAVLYVFQNEVSLRVAKTVSKRLNRLMAKVEHGHEELSEDDVKMLKGWRWRVLLWSE
ncbi:uncharacterized protein B0H64DRAFT_405780 [Chaetomium fimeti]|uniref:Uncharacterized protein n=1 Tax=Chaetomium fimeti TaxID=1854472 RepID=A0AAE0LNN1_9PEZI|nr:hypothetical protein B0H64DRAFT_405780 [Chaetomium fimeti]